MGQQLADKSPGPETGHCHHHTDDASTGDSHQATQSEAAEGHLAPQQGHLDAVQRRKHEGQRQDLQDGRQARLAQQVRYRAGEDDAQDVSNAPVAIAAQNAVSIWRRVRLRR